MCPTGHRNGFIKFLAFAMYDVVFPSKDIIKIIYDNLKNRHSLMTTILSFAKEIMFVVQQIFLLGIDNDLNLKRINGIWHLPIKTDLRSPHFPGPLSRRYLVI